MERQDFINTINDLRETIASLRMTIKTLQKTIDDLNANEKRHSKNDTSFHKIRVVGADAEPPIPSLEEEQPVQESIVSIMEEVSNKPIRLYVSIRTNQGLMIQQNNLTYRQLLPLVEKLEVLC